ncbi:glycosyltransferase [Methanobacterium alkalithermotolerans]|uniref:Glycosyltransferase n=1 Tax=Methanobacterium alkalithermotolerans TaxID=2731220 RepID=A0A8T8K667_9EURY|nr:glycosyltransferase [Methanobacterium alkalithermotolerans]QUH24098.1 glycosyltransferase [Methanobacterium alkalithermotolerans]
MNKKILYIHQGSHPVHGAFASVITSNYVNAGNTYFQMFLRLFNSIKDINYDIAFLEGGMCLPYAYIKKLFNPRMKIILLNADNFFYILPRSNWIKFNIMIFFLSYVDNIIAISAMNKIEASKYFAGDIKVVNSFGVNNYFHNNPHLNSNKLLFIGSHRLDKRYDLLIKAVELLNNEKFKFELYLVGSCCDNIDVDFPWLHKEGFQKNIKYYFEKCSMYIHPSDFDPCPVTIFEAMSAGILTLITKCTGQSDIFSKNNLGCLILEDNDPEIIAEKINEIYQKPFSWKKKISRQCVNTSKKYSQKNQTEKFSAIFKKICQDYSD